MSITILTKQKWLSIFHLEKITFNQFVNKAIIRSSSDKKFKTLLTTNKITMDDARILYKFFVLNRKLYLERFYDTSLKPLNDLDITKIKELTLSNNKNSTHKNYIRNIYYKDILLYTKCEIKNIRTYLVVLKELFNEQIIDYKLVTPSGIAMIKRGLFSNIMSGFYFRSSILNPVVIYSISKKYLKGKNVFTPTLGWSSYMYGFFSNNEYNEYVGTDVISHVCSSTKKIGKHLFPEKKLDIYCTPSEKLHLNKKFMKKYKNYFDTIFFSPPYFKLELYRGKEQSTTSYEDYEDWLKKYWEETIKLCKYVLKKNGTMAYIISGYSKYNNMNKDMNTISKKYFTLKKQKTLGNSNVGMTSHRETKETIYFYMK